MKRKPLLIGGAVLALVALAVVLVLALGGDDEPSEERAVTGPEQAPFRMAYPAAWKPASRQDLQLSGGKVSPGTVAVLRRNDGKGVVVVKARGPLTENARQLERGLTKRLKKRYKDFRLANARTIPLASGGSAFVYTFTRGGQVQSIAVVPAGKRSFTLDAVIPGTEQAPAREVAAMIRSFDPNPES